MSDYTVTTAALLQLEESQARSFNGWQSNSGTSVATSVGPSVFSPASQYAVKSSDVFLGNAEQDENEESVYNDTDYVGSDAEDDDPALNEEALAAEAESYRRYRLIHGPSRANLHSDRHSIEALRQNQLNTFILKYTKNTQAGRQDHHIMLRQLIGHAFDRDPDCHQNRPQWKRIVAAVRKEYWGANAIFTLSPDPYHNVLAKLSSMMLWDDEVRRWQYTYNDSELTRRRSRQTEVLEQLHSTGKLFL